LEKGTGKLLKTNLCNKRANKLQTLKSKCMNWKHVCLTGAIATSMLFAACDKDNDTDETLNAQDNTFLVKASQSNRSEIELSNLALTRSTDSGVLQYAQMMITDHTTAQNDLRDIADDVDADANLQDSLDAEQIAMRNMLSPLSGTSFDSAYIAGQILSHQKTLTLFDAQLSGGLNTRVKGYATTYRPAIQHHHHMADSLFTARFE
jgi:putative membrane protein